MQKIKVGDKVKVLIGKDKGREGEVGKYFPKGDKVLLPGINVYKKHVKGVSGGQKSGRYDLPRPLSLGKVALVCPNCKKTTRIGFKFIGDVKKRVCKKCGREIDAKEVKKNKKK